jgi:putative transposase
MKNRIQEETDRFRNAKSNKASLPKTGNTSKLAKFNDVGSEGPSSINTTPDKQDTTSVFDAPEQLFDDDFEDIEGY